MTQDTARPRKTGEPFPEITQAGLMELGRGLRRQRRAEPGLHATWLRRLSEHNDGAEKGRSGSELSVGRHTRCLTPLQSELLQQVLEVADTRIQPREDTLLPGDRLQ